MNTQDRRRCLVVKPPPDSRADYVVVLEAGWTLPSRPGIAVTLVLRYVPDRRLLDPACLGAYLKAIGLSVEPDLEHLAVALRDDLCNELVPRWFQAQLSAPQPDAGGIHRHAVVLEERQPGWDNRALLAGLGAV